MNSGAHNTAFFNKLGRTGRTLLAIGLFFASTAAIHADSWYNASWKYRQALTITGKGASTATISNFPVLVHLKTSASTSPSGTIDNLLFGNVKSNLYDLVFTSSDGTTKLAHEIETYSSTDLWVWVKLPGFSVSAGGTDNDIYAYYGNAASGNQANRAGVWDANYKVVQHMDETGDTFYDSTANAVDGTRYNVTTGVGKIGDLSGTGGAQTWTGTDMEGINLSNVTTTGWTSLTVEAWVNRTAKSRTDFERILAQGAGSGGSTLFAAGIWDTTGTYPNQIGLMVSPNNTGTPIMGTTSTTGSYEHVVVTWNAGTTYFYVDGTQYGPFSGTDASIASPGALTPVLAIGNSDLTSGTKPFCGRLDEVRLSGSKDASAARNANWVRASYENQNAPAPSVGVQQVFLGGKVYSDEGSSPLSGATVNVVIGGSIRGTATSDSSGNWGAAIQSSYISSGTVIAAYIDAASSGAVWTTSGGSNLYDLDIYRGDVIVRNDNSASPAIANFNSSGAAGLSNCPLTAASATSATLGAYTLYLPTGVTFQAGAAAPLTVGGISGPGTLDGGTAAIAVAGNFTPGAFSSGTSTVTFTGTGSTGSYTFNNAAINASGYTRTATGAWTITGALTLTAGTFAPGAFTHNVAGAWAVGASATFAPTAGTIRLTGSGTVGSSGSGFWNLTIAGATRTLTALPTVKGNLTIESGAVLAAANNTITLSGNWTNLAGTAGYTSSGGGVTFADPSKTSTISGNTNFYAFSSFAGSKILAFESGSTQGVTSSLNISNSTSLVRAGGSGTDQWHFNVTAATKTINTVNVSDSYADVALTAAGTSLDLGNNTNWSGFSSSAYTWDGDAADGLWDTAANWGGNAVPPNVATYPAVVIPSGISTWPSAGTSELNIDTLKIASGASLTVTGGTAHDVWTSFDNQGTLYRRNLATTALNSNFYDTNSGTTVYEGTGGTIQDYGANDYYNLTIDSYGETFIPGAPLHVLGDLTVTSGTLNLSGQNLVVDGNLTVASGAAIALGSGTVTVTGNVLGSGTITGGSGTVNVGGNWSATNFVKGTSTVSLSGTGASLGAGSFHNLTVATGATVALAGAVSVGNNLVITGTLDGGTRNLAVTGNVTGTGSLVMGSGTATLDGNLAVTGFTCGTGTVICNGTSGLGGSYTFNNLTVNSGASLSTYVTLGTTRSTTVNGTFTNKGTLYRQGGDYISQTDATQGTVVYAGTAGAIQTYSGDDYWNLTLGTASYTLASDLSIAGNLSFLNAGAGLSVGSSTISLAGNFDNSAGGTFTAGTGTVQLVNAATASTISGANTFYTLTSTAAGKSITVSGTQTLATGGAFSITGTASSYIILNGGTLTLNGTATATAYYATITGNTVAAAGTAYYSTLSGTTGWASSGSTYTWYGAGPDWATAANWRVGSTTPGTPPTAADAVVIPASPTGGNMPSLAANTSVASLTNSGVLTIAGYTLTVSGALTNAGTIKRTTQTSTTAQTISAGTYDFSQGTIEYTSGANYLQDFGSQDYYNLTIDSGVTANLRYNLGINGNLTNAGTISAGAYTIAIGGNWANTGTFTYATSTVIFNDATKTSAISGTNTFYDLTIVTAGKTVNFGATTTTIAAGGALTVTGESGNLVTLTGTGWTITRTGTASVDYAYIRNSSISASQAANHSVDGTGNNANWVFAADYVWTGANGATNTNWNNNANWNPSTGYPNSAAQSVTIPNTAYKPTLNINATVGTLSIASGATLTTNSSTTLTATTLNVNGSLTLGATSAALGVADLSIYSGASLDIGSGTVTVTGSYDNGGTLKRASGSSMNVTDTDSGTVIYQGTTAGTIQNYATGDDYWNLQIGDGSNAVTWAMGAAIQTAGSLTVSTDATLSTGSWPLTATGATTVTGTLTGGSGALTFTGAATIDGILTASSGTTTFASTISKSGTFNANGGTVVLTDAPSLSESFTFNNLTVNSAGTVSLGIDQTVAGNLTLTSGTLNLNGWVLSLGGNLTKTGGTFNAGSSGTLSFVDATKVSAVTGAITWPGLRIGLSGSPMGGKTVQFEAGKTQTVTGSLSLYGASGNPAILTSSGTWTLAPSANASATYVSVTNSDVTTYAIDATSSVNVSGNTLAPGATTGPGWYFERPTSFTWVGGTSSAWDNAANWAEGNGTYYPGWSGSALTITTDTVTLPSSAGNWPSLSAAAVTVDSITIPAGAQLSLSKALTVTTAVTNYGTITVASGGSISKNDSASAHGGTVAMTAAGAVDSLAGTSYCNLTLSGSAAYTNSAALTINGNLAINSGSTLTLAAASHAVSGSLTGTGTLNAGAATALSVGSVGTAGTAFGSLSAPASLSIGGALNASNFTNNSGAVIMTGAGTVVGAWTSTAKRFNNLTINSAAGTVTLSGNIFVSGNLTISTGTLNSASKAITVYGNWTNSVGAAGFTCGSGTVEIYNDATHLSHAVNGDTTFYNLTSTTTAFAATITFDSGSTTTVAAGGTLTLTGASGNLLTLTGTAAWYLDMKSAVAPSLSWISIRYSDLMTTSLTPTNAVDGGLNDTGTDGTTTAQWTLFIDYVWNGLTSTDCSDSTNWTPNGVPTANDKVTIPTTPTGNAANFPIMDASTPATVTIKSLTMAAGSSLALAGHKLIITQTVSKLASATIRLWDGADIDTSATSQGADYLLLNGIVNYNAPSGTYSIKNTAATGDDYAALTVSGAATYSTASAIQTPALTLAMTGGSVAFAGGLSVTATLAVNAGAYDVSITGASNSITPAATFNNTGALFLGASGGTTTFTGALTATAPSGLTAAGSVTAASMNLLSATTKTLTVGAAATSLSTGGAGTLQIGGAVTDGTNSYTLTLGDASQTGAITIGGAVTVYGLATGAGAFALYLNGDGESANYSTVDAAINFTNTGALRLGNAASDRLTFTGGVTGVSAATGISLAGAIAATGNPLNLNKAVTLLAATTLSSGTGTLTLGGTVGGAFPLTLGTCSASSTFGGAVSAITGLTLDTGATFTPASTVSVAGNLALTSGTLAMAGNALSVNADVTRTAGTGIITSSGTITFNGSLAAQSVNLTGSSVTNLEVNNSFTTPTVTLANTATFTWSGNAVLTAGTLKLANLTGQTIGGSVTGTAASSKLDLSAIASGNSVNVTGSIGTSAATALTALAAPAGTLNVAGSVWNVAALTLTATPGTTAFTGSAAQTIVPAGQTFGPVTATGSGGVALTGTAIFTSLDISTGETFSIGGAVATSLTLSGTGTNVLKTGTSGGLRWNASGAAASLNFTGAAPEISNAYFGGLQVTAGSATNVASLNGASAANRVVLLTSALDLNGQALTVSNLTTIAAHSLTAASSALTLSGSNTFNGGLTVNNGTAGISIGASTLTASALTVTAGGCTIGAGSTSVTGALTVNGGTLTVSGTPTSFSAGSLDHSSGTITNTASYNLSVSGDVTVAGTFGVSTASTITMTGASKNLAPTSQLYNLAVSGSAGLITHALSLAGTLNLSGTLSDTANNLGIAITGTSTINGTLNAGSGTDSFAAVTGTGTLNASSGTTTISGGLSITNFAHDSGSVTLTGGSTGAYIFYNLAINGNATATGDWTVNRNWTYTSGTITWNSHAVILATATTATIAGSASFYSLSCTVPGKTIQFTDGTTQTINGTLTLTGAANSLITLTHTSSTPWTINNAGSTSVSYVDVSWGLVTTASITAATSHDNGNNGSTAPCWVFSATDLTWDGSSDTDWDTPANWDRGYVPNATDRIIIPSSGVLNTLTLDGTARTVVQATVNGSLDAGSATTVTLTGTAAGTLTVASGAAILTPANTTWRMTGSGATIASSLASTIGNLTIAPGALATISLGAALYIRDLTLTSGTFDAAALSLYVAGNISGPGAITSTGLLTLNGSSAQSVAIASGSSSLAALTVSNTYATSPQVTASTAITLTGNLTLTSGTLAMGANTLTMGGTGTASISYTSGALSSTGTIAFTSSGSGTQSANLGFSTAASPTLAAISASKTAGTLSFSSGFGAASFTVAASPDNAFDLSFNTTAGAQTTAFTSTSSTAFINTGTLSLGNDANDAISFAGGLSRTSGGTTTLAGSISSTDGAINLGMAVSLAADTTIDTNATASNTADITLGAVTGSSNSLTLETGSGIAGANVSGTTFTGTGTIALQNIGGTASFTGTITAAALTVPNTVANVSLTGTGSSITGAVAFHNTGTLTLGQSGGTQSYGGGIATNAVPAVGGTVTLNGTIQTTNDDIAFAAVTLGSAVTLTTQPTAAAGSIGIGTLTGAGNNLTLTAGTGISQTGAWTSSSTTATLTAATWNAGAAAVNLPQANNFDIVSLRALNLAGTLAAAGTITYADTNGFAISALQTSGWASLTNGGAVTQSAAVATGALLLRGSGTWTLTTATNDSATLAASCTGAVSYVDANALTVGTITDGTGAVSGIATNGGNLSITATTGTLTLAQNSSTGAGTVDLYGTTSVDSPTASTAISVTSADRAIVFHGATTLSDDLQVTSSSSTGGAVTFSSTLSGAHDLSVANGTGTVTFADAVGSTALGDGAGAAITVSGTGATTFSSSVTTASGLALTGNATFNGNAAIDTAGTGDTPTTVNGATTIGAAVTSFQAGRSVTFGDATGDTIAINATAALAISTTANNGNLEFWGPVGYVEALTLTANGAGQVIFHSNVAVSSGTHNLTVTSGAISLNGVTVTSGGGNIAFTVDNLIQSGSTINAGAGTFTITPKTASLAIEFAPADSAAAPYNTAIFIDSDFTGITAASFTLGGATHTGIVYLGNNLGGAAAFPAPLVVSQTNAGAGGIYLQNSFSSSGNNLTLSSASGGIRFNTAVSPAIDLGTGSFSETGAVTIAANTTLAANGGITLNGAVSDGTTNTHDLALNSSGTTTLAGTVGSAVNTLLSLTTDASGTTALNGGSVYATTQTWNDAVTLGSGTTLTGTDVSFVSTLNSFDTTYRALTINASGATSFAGTVGATNPLASITTDAGGTTAINAPAITTNTTQTFNDALSLGVTANLTGTAVYFYGTVDGNAHNLTVTGAAQFGNGTADTVTDMGTLLVTLTSSIYADITTTGTQTWTGNATLGSNVTLTASSARFYGTVTGAAHSLAISGAAVFGNGTADTVAGVTTLQVSGITDIYTASMGATTQTYGDTTGTDTITLHAGATFTGTTVTFNAPVVGGTNSLTVSGNAIFGDTTGDDTVTGVAFLDVSGTTGINTTAITTSGAQTYDSNATGTDTITLGAEVVLTGGAITINSPVAGGAHSLTITNSGVFTTAATGDITAGGGFTQNGGGTNTLAGDISTANTDITFATAVTLGGAVVLDTDTGTGDISIPSITGAGYNLGLISGSGTTTVSGNATGIGVLSLQENAATSTGSVSFQGNLGATGITTFARNYSINLTGTTTTVSTTAVTFSNTGTLTLGNASTDSLTFTAGVTATAPLSVSVSGTMAAAGTGAITLGDSDTPLTIAATSIIGGATGSGTITLTSGGTATLASGTTLTIGQGSASNIVAGAIATAAVGHLAINSTAVAASTIASFIPTTAASTLTIANVGTGGLSFTGDAGAGATPLSSVTFASTISSTGTVSFNGALYATAMTVTASATSAAYGIAFNAGGSITGAVAFGNTGNLAVGNDAADSFTFTGGAAKTVGTRSFAGHVNASGAAILNFGTAGTATVTADAWLGGTTGAITLWDTIINNGFTLDLGNGSAAPVTVNAVAGVALGSASNLTIDNVGANATITGDVATDIGAVTITKSGGTMLFSGDVTAATLDPQAGAYSVTMNGGTGTGTATTIANAVTFLNTGALVLGDAAEDAFTFTAGMTSNVVASNTFQGTVATGGASGQDIALDELTVGANGLVVNTGSGAAGTGTITVANAGTGTVAIPDSVTLDLGSSNFAFDVLQNGTTPADLGAAANAVFRLTGAQTTHTVATFATTSGITEYYGSSAGTVFCTGLGGSGNPYWNLRIAAGSGIVKTLEGDIAVNNDVTIAGGVLDVDAAGNYRITLYGDWDNQVGAAGFLSEAGTVTFAKPTSKDAGIITVLGSNDWYIFECLIPGITIEFQNDTVAAGIAILQTIKTGGKFRIRGISGNNINLTRPAAVSGAPTNPPVSPTQDDLFWFFDLTPGATLDMAYVNVYYSNARLNPVTIPATVNARPYATYFCYKWLDKLYAIWSYTEDSDYDGKIDRIRVTTEADVGSDFSGFRAVVEGYVVSGYSRPGVGKTFYILLQEKPYLDTGVTPDWYVADNTSLLDEATDSKFVGTVEATFGSLRSNGSERGEWMTPGDGAWPRVGYTLTLPDGAQTFAQFSEEVGSSTTAPVVGSDAITLVTGTAGVREALTPASSPAIAALASGTTVSFNALADNGAAPHYETNYSTLVIGLPYPNWPPTSGYTNAPDAYTLGSSWTDRPAFTLAGGAYPNNVHRLSDVLISIDPELATATTYFAWPVWAKDSVSTEVAQADYESLTGSQASSSTIGLVRDFTGGKWLRDQDITLEVRTGTGMGTPSFVFDANVGSAYIATAANGPTGLWLPAFTEANNAAGFSGIVPLANTATDSIAATAVGASTDLWDVAIDADNAKIRSVSTLGFFFHLAGSPADLVVGRLDAAQGVIPTDWYRRVKPFSFDIHDVTLQRSGVTIMNNVIDPTTGETVRLSYQLTKSGPVTIQVFTLDGDLVQVLYRGSRPAGDYTATWDGRNKGGRAVARGMYFIRIVAPNIDEIRKVMIVK